MDNDYFAAQESDLGSWDWPKQTWFQRRRALAILKAQEARNKELLEREDAAEQRMAQYAPYWYK